MLFGCLKATKNLVFLNRLWEPCLSRI